MPDAAAVKSFPLHAVLWGAPLARGVPLPDDCEYYMLTRLPTPLDNNYVLLSRGYGGGFRELRGSSMRPFELATAAHPRGGVGSAEVRALREEALRCRDTDSGEGRASRRRRLA